MVEGWIDMPTNKIAKIAAVIVILDVIAVYFYCLRVKGVYPPSHPWSGIAFVLLSVSLVLGWRHRKPTLAASTWVSVVLILLSACFWTVSASL